LCGGVKSHYLEGSLMYFKSLISKEKTRIDCQCKPGLQIW